MVRLDRVKDSVRVNHPVPRTVGFKIVRSRIRRRMVLLEGAEIRDLGPASIWIHANNAVVGSRQPMRTARARDQRVEGAVDESHIADPTTRLPSAGLVWLEGRWSATVVTTPWASTLEIRAVKSPVYGPGPAGGPAACWQTPTVDREPPAPPSAT